MGYDHRFTKDLWKNKPRFNDERRMVIHEMLFSTWIEYNK